MASCYGGPEPLDLDTTRSVALAVVEQQQPMGPPKDDPHDWLRLVSDEWLKGELLGLRKDSLEFDSDKVDTVNLDWEDVAEVHSPRTHTLLLEDNRYFTGRLKVVGDKLWLLTADDPREVDRSQLLAIVPGDLADWHSRWSGDLFLGATLRGGNTEEIDSNSNVVLRRETAATRWDTSYEQNLSSVEGQRVTNTHRASTRFDWFLTRRLFVTPAALTWFRDPNQNINNRWSPSMSIGYDIVDDKAVEWALAAGPAMRITEYVSVPAGEDKQQEIAVFALSSTLAWDITSDLEFDLEYSIASAFEDPHDYTQRLAAHLEIDLTGDLDLELRVIWDRINEPVANAAGELPGSNDYQTIIGLSYEF